MFNHILYDIYLLDVGGQYSGGFVDGKKDGEGSNHVMRPDSQWELYKVTQ